MEKMIRRLLSISILFQFSAFVAVWVYFFIFLFFCFRCAVYSLAGYSNSVTFKVNQSFHFVKLYCKIYGRCK